MFHKSYKLRVALWSCIISGFVLLLFMSAVSFNLKTEFAELVDYNMEGIAAAVLLAAKNDAIQEDPFLNILAFDENSFRGSIYDEEEYNESPDRNLKLLAIRRPDKSYAYLNREYWKESYIKLLENEPEIEIGSRLESKNSPQPHREEIEESDARWEIRKYLKDGYTAYIAINQHESKDEYIEFMYLGAMALPIAFIAVALGGWWLGVYATRPMKEISRVVSSIEADDLTTRVPHGGREDEIGELAKLMNDMLNRIELGYAQAKRFTADASHELRTPLAILQGEIEARMRNATDTDAASSGRMLEEIRRLKTLTHSLLFLSKADAGNLKVEKEPLNFSSLVSQIFSDIAEISESYELDFDDSEIQSNITLKGDSSLLQQTVMNLLRNATKFNRKGGRVSCSLSVKDGFAFLAIGNTGSGIPSDKQGKVFDRFQRVDEGRNRDKGGFGLGLNIAREIARSHDGEIELRESGNDWTVFELKLPVA